MMGRVAPGLNEKTFRTSCANAVYGRGCNSFQSTCFTAIAMTSDRDILGMRGQLHGKLHPCETLSPAFIDHDGPNHFTGWMTPTMTPLIC